MKTKKIPLYRGLSVVFAGVGLELLAESARIATCLPYVKLASPIQECIRLAIQHCDVSALKSHLAALSYINTVYTLAELGILAGLVGLWIVLKKAFICQLNGTQKVVYLIIKYTI